MRNSRSRAKCSRVGQTGGLSPSPRGVGCLYNPSSAISQGDFMSAHMPSHPSQPPPKPQSLPGVEAIVAVGSGKGGVGKTTLAVNLALALAKFGRKTGLLDADVYGPNVPLMLGASAQPRVLGENRIEPVDVHGVKLISVGLLNPGDKPVIWRGPMLHSIIRQFLGSVAWGRLEYLIVD